MWDGYLARVIFAKHRIGLLPADAEPTHSAAYPGSKTRELEKNEIEKMLSEGIIDTDEATWPASIVFAPKKDAFLFFCVYY